MDGKQLQSQYKDHLSDFQNWDQRAHAQEYILYPKNASMLYSIIETCKMNGLRPVKYIAEILTKLTAGETNYMSLLPINNNKEY